MIVASPYPLASSQAFVAATPSATESTPSRSRSPFDELMYGALPTNASGHRAVSSVGSMPWAANHSSGGRWIGGTSSPKAAANSKSRWSPHGTAMIAPVP